MFAKQMMAAVIVVGLAGAAHDSAAQQRIRIVSIGDSLASGEGNPDEEAPHLMWDGSRDAADHGWGVASELAILDGQDWGCHRSQLAGHKLTAELLGGALPDDDVQFTSVACTGAKIPDLITVSQTGGVIPQLDRVSQLFPPGSPDSAIDVLLISIGINDMGFADAVFNCATDPDCTDDPAFAPDKEGAIDPWLGDPTQSVALDGGPPARSRKLKTRWDRLIAAVETKLPNVGMVIVHEYPEGMTDRFGGWCHGFMWMWLWTPWGGWQWTEVPLDDPGLAGISSAEARWASQSGLAPLNAAVRTAVTAADHSRWQYVDGIASRFNGHGFCASDQRWINTIRDSSVNQNDLGGSVHPNSHGHDVYATVLRDRLTAIDWNRARATPGRPVVPAFGATTASGATLRMATPTSVSVPWDHGGTPAMFFQVATRFSPNATAPADPDGVPWHVPGAPSASLPTTFSDPPSGWSTQTRVGDGATRELTVSLPKPGAWRIAVRACSYERCSAWTPTIPVDTVAPTAPTGLARTGASGNTIEASWTGTSSLAKMYQLAWRPWSGGAWTYKTVAAPSTSSKIGFGGPGRYDVFVRACANVACSPWAPGMRIATSLPPQPTNLTRWPTVGASLFGVQLAWSNPAVASGGVVQLAVRTSAYQIAYGNLAYNATSLFVDWEDMSWVRACNEGGCTAWSSRIGGTGEAPPANAPTPGVPAVGPPPPS